MSQAATTVKPFITLQSDCSGMFVPFWTGGPGSLPFSKLPYKKDGTLEDLLARTKKKLLKIQGDLGRAYRRIDRGASGQRNVPISREFNGVAAWAYALALEIIPFQSYYKEAPCNLLYREHIYPLEEVYLKCFAMAHVFGGQDESLVGLRGLLTDFIASGGIAPDGGPGHGLGSTTLGHVRGYFEPLHSFEPILYERFGELNQAISDVVIERYPRVARALAASWAADIKHLFTRTDIVSSSRDEMLEKWRGMIEQLQQVEVKTSLLA